MPTTPELLAEYSELDGDLLEPLDDSTHAQVEPAVSQRAPSVPPPIPRHTRIRTATSPVPDAVAWMSSLFTQKELIALLSPEEALTAFLDSAHPAVETIEALAILSDRELVDLIDGKVPPSVMNALVACAKAMKRLRSTP